MCVEINAAGIGQKVAISDGLERKRGKPSGAAAIEMLGAGNDVAAVEGASGIWLVDMSRPQAPGLEIVNSLLEIVIGCTEGRRAKG